AASVAGAPPALLLRTISYLTCTASRASKKSLARNSASVTCSGCGFRQRAPASAASLGSGPPCRLAMPPPHPDGCKDDSAGHRGWSLAYEAACHGISILEKQEYSGTATMITRETNRDGIIPLTFTA